MTLKQSLSTKITALHGLLIKFSNTFNNSPSTTQYCQWKRKRQEENTSIVNTMSKRKVKVFNIMKSMNKCVKKLLPNNTKIDVAFKSTKLSTFVNVKDKIDFEHNHDLIYHKKCPEPTCFMWGKDLVELQRELRIIMVENTQCMSRNIA